MTVELPYSYHIGTGAQSRETDRLTIEKFGIDGFTLMETAGLQAAQFISNQHQPGSKGLYVCGKGNNAGDAIVAARYLSIHHRHHCQILFLAGESDLSPDAEKNHQLLKKLSDSDPGVRFLTGWEQLDKQETSGFDYVIDGMLGTGLSTHLRSPFDKAVERINSINATIYAMDIPTGLHTDEGIALPVAVRADFTLSFGIRKLGFYLQEGPAHTGNIQQFDLSFPREYRESICSLLVPESGAFFPPIRREALHKYSDKVVYLVAGSEGLTGAAIMAARSSWNSGAGAVILITPKGQLSIYEQTLPEIIKSPVGKDSDRHFSSKHLEQVSELINQKDGILLIGPGLGRKSDTLTFTKKLLHLFNGTAVIDADALLAVKDAKKPEKADWILTPHPGEAATLRGKGLKNDYDRILWADSYSKEKGITVVSKGSPVFIGTKSGENYLTGYNTKIFARAGFGDVLAGSIAAYTAITDYPAWSINRALLDGYQRAIQIQEMSGKPPKPIDLL